MRDWRFGCAAEAEADEGETVGSDRESIEEGSLREEKEKLLLN